MTSGIIEQQLRRYFSKSDKYFDDKNDLSDNEFKSLVLEDYTGVMAVLFIALMICSLIILGEIIHNSFDKIIQLSRKLFIEIIIKMCMLLNYFNEHILIILCIIKSLFNRILP